MTLTVILLPYADTSHASLVLVMIAGAVAMGVFMVLFAPAIGDSAYASSDVLGVLSIAFGVYLTGGTTSPLLPLVFLQATFAAYFSPPRGALLRLLGVVLVCASPFTYAPDGAQLAFVVRVIAIVTTATVLVGIILYNKRELAQAEESSRELASHDPLTGLPNRRSFRRDVIRALRETGAGAGLGLSIAIIDVDNFKRVNDLHGHAAGDELLTRIARALSGVTREADIVARIGGDEFALLAPGADASTAQMLGERCVEATETAVIEAGYAECDVSATVGYALFPQHGATFQELLQAADSALMNAKDRGKHMVASAPARAPALATPRSPVVTHSAPATA